MTVSIVNDGVRVIFFALLAAFSFLFLQNLAALFRCKIMC